MDNIYVVTPSAVDCPKLRQLVEELGGCWNEDPTLDQGVVERRKAAIFISLAANFRSEYDPEDLAAVRIALGAEPESAIDVHIGHGAGSPDLAEEFARTVIDRWGGVIDRDSQPESVQGDRSRKEPRALPTLVHEKHGTSLGGNCLGGSLDITGLMRSRRLCIYASWPLYIAASLSLLLVLTGIQWLFVPAALIALGFASGRGSLSAGLLQALLVVGFAIWLFSLSSPEERRDPFLLAIGLAVVLPSLVGLAAAVAYRRRLPPKGGIGRSRPARALLPGVPIRRIAASAGSFLLGVALLLPLPLLMTAGVVLDIGPEDLVAKIEAPTWQWVVVGVPVGMALFALFILSLGAASWLITRAKRLATPAAGEARHQDPRRPVLLLRSFADDQTPVARAPTLNRTFSDYHSTARTVEDVIEKELRVYGPVIAVGRPGESLPPAGAAREYLADEEWQPRVRELMAEARLVVVVLGQSEGLRYEYRALIEEGAIERTVLVFPPQSGEDVIVRWAAAARGMGIGGERPTLPSPERTLSAVLVDRLEPRFVTCRWRDDESYRHALRWSAAMLERGSSPPTHPNGAPPAGPQ